MASALDFIIAQRRQESEDAQNFVTNFLTSLKMAQEAPYRQAMTDYMTSQSQYRNLANKMISDSMNPSNNASSSGSGLLDTVTPNQGNLMLKSIGAKGPTFVNPNAPQATTITPQTDIEQTAKGVAEGTIPPDKAFSYRDISRGNAALQRLGVNLPDLSLEWDASKKFVASSNGVQQTRLRQSIDFAQETAKNLQKMNEEFRRSDNPILNSGQLALAKQGAFGQDMAKKAVLYEQQINDLDADLANVYMGGNSPTDHGLQLAQSNLKSNWSNDVADAALDNIMKLTSFRKNAIAGAAPMVKGKFGTRYYQASGGSSTVDSAQGGSSPAVEASQAPDTDTSGANMRKVGGITYSYKRI